MSRVQRTRASIAAIGVATFLGAAGYTTVEECEALTGATRTNYEWLGLEWSSEVRNSPAAQWAAAHLSDPQLQRWSSNGSQHHSILPTPWVCGAFDCAVPVIYGLEIADAEKLEMLAEWQRDVIRAESNAELRRLGSAWWERIEPLTRQESDDR